MRNLFLSLLFFFVVSLFQKGIAQEQIFPLNANPEIFRTQIAQQKILYPNLFFWFEQRTVPFIDDFTSSKYAVYDSSFYPQTNKSDTSWVSFKVNGSTPVVSPPADSIFGFMYSPSYTYSWNSATSSVDSIQQPSLNITFYERKDLPSKTTSSLTLWSMYERPVFDANGVIIDSDTIPPDTIIQLNAANIHFVKIPQGICNWASRDAYINRNMGVNPPSYGVMTFDGLDSVGLPYNFIPASYDLADQQISVPFDLSTAGDSVWFTFFWQPQGYGNSPEPEDSIQLEFQSEEKDWIRVWGKTGRTIDSDSTFVREDILINDTLLLTKGFRFRFRNWATLSGNVDHWNIDYIRIDADSALRDITMQSQGLSIYSSISQIPYNQYSPSVFTPDRISNRVRNLGQSSVNVDYSFRVMDYGGTVYNSISVGNVDFNANSVNSCNNCNQILNPLVGNSFSLPETTRCAKYSIIHVVRNVSAENNRSNDTLIYTQAFTDCYAYDDGSAEAAYGITSPYAQMAVRYDALRADTIKALRIYFNPMVEDARPYQFTIVIWNEDSNGKPGSELYRRSTTYNPSYGNGINGFVDYPIDDATVILSGKFFVGLEQISPSPLNIGLDRNTNFRLQQYYRSAGTWFQTQFDGSWMIRPVFESCPFDVLDIKESYINEFDFRFFPNPANSEIQLSLPPGKYSIEVFSVLGGKVFSGSFSDSESLDISFLSAGLYFIRASGTQGVLNGASRLLIAR
ncbi:MAG: hypothetical protein RLZZ46_136 [Bacteroidota bacterium]|jgi:hypothetical protein